jgi:hypothetical protein
MITAATEFEIPVELHLGDGLREQVEAQIARVNTGFLVLSSPIALEPGRKLSVLYLKRQIRCETAYCVRERAGAYRVGARMLDGTDGALRAERRIRLDTCAQLGSPGFAEPITVRIVDMSSSGLGVKVTDPLTVGHLAYVELEHGVAFGEIRHCEKTDEGYRAGLFIEEFITRTPGGLSPWAAHGREVPGRTAAFSVARALRTVLSGNKKF